MLRNAKNNKCFACTSCSLRSGENMFTLRRVLVLTLASAAFCRAEIGSTGKAESNDDIEELFSVVKGTAHLPCNLTAPTATDGPRLVLWYKDGDPNPIYSYDARFTTIKHWSELPEFSARAEFRDFSDPAQLMISQVTMEDAGIYGCRVDFRDSPTRTVRMRLTIVEEPRKPVVLDEEGSSVMGEVGPFRLGRPLILVCIVEGGDPRPDVVWFRDGERFDDETDPSTYEEVLQNTLVIGSLEREHHGNRLECRAINNNVTQPPSASVTLVLEMPILSVTLSNLPDPVTAEVTYEALCQVTGAQPVPQVTWKLGEIELEPEEPRLTHDQNLTTSLLHFTPKITDQDRVLSCVADNGVFPKQNKSLPLKVYFVPVVHAEIVGGSSGGESGGDGDEMIQVDPTNIREGDDIEMECKIQARPWVWRTLWYRDGTELKPSTSNQSSDLGGTIIHIEEQRLKLTNVSKAASGQYVCSASNVEGDGFSRPLSIAVKYRPVCVASAVEYKNHSEGIDLRCQVDAKPKSSTFRWLFNSSDTHFEIPSAEATMSFGNYRATEGGEHGEVLCWATNSLGEQEDPCVFHVVPLGTPTPPSNCQISNHTASTIEVSCSAGFSGGLAQHFVMEVYETTANNTQALVASNWTSHVDPNTGLVSLVVTGLLPDYSYIVSVRAANERGSSSPVYVGGKTGEHNAAMPLPRAVDESRAPLLVVLVGILVSLMVLGACFTAAFAAMRARARRKMRAAAEAAEIEHSLRKAAEARNNEHQQQQIYHPPQPSRHHQANVLLNNLVTPTTNATSSSADTTTESDAASLPLIDRNVESTSPVRIVNGNGSMTVDRATRGRSAESGTGSSRASPDRKVSFREGGGNPSVCAKCGGRTTLQRPRRYRASNIDGKYVPSSSNTNLNGDLNKNNNNGHTRGGSMLPVERAVVRTFSVEKLRPICPTCNPSGGTPYPSESQALDDIVSQSTALINQAS